MEIQEEDWLDTQMGTHNGELLIDAQTIADTEHVRILSIHHQVSSLICVQYRSGTSQLCSSANAHIEHDHRARHARPWWCPDPTTRSTTRTTSTTHGIPRILSDVMHNPELPLHTAHAGLIPACLSTLQQPVSYALSARVPRHSRPCPLPTSQNGLQRQPFTS